jgi:cell division protein FtsQ
LQRFITGELLSGYVPCLGVGWTGAGLYDRCRRFLATFAQGLRSGNLFSKRDTAVLDQAPGQDRASIGATAGLKRRAPVTEMPLRRNSAYTDDYMDSYDSEPEPESQARRPTVRVSFRGGLVPKTLWGRIAAGAGLAVVATAGVAAALWARSFLLHDEHFVIPTSDAIQIAGNGHLTRAQLLSVFGEDVDRNIFNVPLAERRAELESLPWVAHATVMRFLPNRIRVAVVERTPVAFVRQGQQIGLVDANGVLFDLPGPEVGGAKTTHSGPEYSFPVLTGISAGDPLSTRAARMRIYLDFMAAMDATGEGISQRLSEVDVSNPEDVKAIVPDQGTAGADILVHFGEEKFLERYHQYQAHLAEWRAQYPKLASVDMRYEQQVVLEMQQGAIPPPSAPAAPATASDVADAAKVAPAPVMAAPAPAKTRQAAKLTGRPVVHGHMKATGMGTHTQGAPQ